MSARSMRSILVNVGLSVASTCAFLALIEGGARLVEARRPERPAVAEYIWDWDSMMPGGFYVMKSDAAGWPPWEEFNGDGLRDRTRPHEKAEGLRRVAVLGDSVTLGAETRPEQAYPQLLEAGFRAEGRPIEVMNVALWGWSTRQERTAWERIARTYHPDTVVLAVCLNDIPELFNNLSRPPSWLAAAHERSALVRLAVNATGREIENVERLFAEPEPREVKQAVEGFFDEVRLLRRAVEADGASFSVIVFPFRFQVEPGAPRATVQERIGAFCRSEGVACLDLLPTMAVLGPRAFADYDHLSPEGARATAEALLRSGLLPRADAAADVLRRAVAVQRGRGVTDVREWLASGHGKLSSDGTRTLASLLSAKDTPTRLAAAWALEKAGGGAGFADDALLKVLGEDPASGVRAAAAEAILAGPSGARGTAAVRAAALHDRSEAVRYQAARALARLPARAEDVSWLVEALRSDDAFVSAFAAWTLGNLGETAHDAVPALAQALESGRNDAVIAAALARIGPAAAGAVPALVQSLSESSADRRWRAARTLGRIGPPARQAVEALATSLRDENVAVRMHAARALGRIGVRARAVTDALQRVTGDPDETVRREARQAVDRLHREGGAK